MSNTQRTDAELLQLFADNNIGGISAQDLRDLIVSKVSIDNQIGQLTFAGSWDASTNTPTLTSSSGTTGHYYLVSTAGTTTLDGISDWEVGNWLVFNGSTWVKIEAYDYTTPASQSAQEAKNWANYPEDQLVPEGDGVDDYSAYHYAKKAETYGASTEIVAPYITEIETVSNNISDVTTTATNISNITTTATDITNINTAATNISDINSVVTNIVDIQNAEENALLSKDYATKAEDVEVESGTYSAYHYSLKAADNSRLSIGTVTTGTPGTSASATIDGIAGAQELSLTIPRGDVGPQGELGPKGDVGPTGPPGDSAYDEWLSAGNTGTEQDFLDSLIGPQGTQGETGPEGDSAYDLAASAGFSGTEQEWLDSLEGRGIESILRTSGNGAPGITDTYTITYTDATTSTFAVYNGADGEGTGDMLKSTYDTNNSGIVDNSELVNGLTVETAVPLNAVFTDTIYDDSDVLKDFDIGVTVQPYDADTVVAPSGVLPTLDGSNLTNVSSVAGIDDLTDVDTTTATPSVGDTLVWDGTNWIPGNNTTSLSDLGITATPTELNKLDGVTATTTELNYTDGVTSNIQTQLNGKAASSHNHDASNITSGILSESVIPTASSSIKGGARIYKSGTTGYIYLSN